MDISKYTNNSGTQNNSSENNTTTRIVKVLDSDPNKEREKLLRFLHDDIDQSNANDNEKRVLQSRIQLLFGPFLDNTKQALTELRKAPNYSQSAKKDINFETRSYKDTELKRQSSLYTKYLADKGIYRITRVDTDIETDQSQSYVAECNIDETQGKAFIKELKLTNGENFVWEFQTKPNQEGPIFHVSLED